MWRLSLQPLPSGRVPPDGAILLSSALYIAVLLATCMMVRAIPHREYDFAPSWSWYRSPVHKSDFAAVGKEQCTMSCNVSQLLRQTLVLARCALNILVCWDVQHPIELACVAGVPDAEGCHSRLGRRDAAVHATAEAPLRGEECVGGVCHCGESSCGSFGCRRGGPSPVPCSRLFSGVEYDSWLKQRPYSIFTPVHIFWSHKGQLERREELALPSFWFHAHTSSSTSYTVKS